MGSEFEEQRRLRWRCRRGLLELDLVLGRFVDRHFSLLDAGEREAFFALLDMPDTELWDMITGRGAPPSSEAAQAVLEMMGAA